MSKQTAQPARRGRPPLPSAARRASQINVRVTDAEMAAIAEAAKRDGMTRSEWVVRVLFERIDHDAR